MGDYEMLTAILRDRAGLDLTQYKAEQAQRRVQNALTRMGIPSVADLLRRSRSDQRVFQELVDHITINVSEFFRNPELFEVLGRSVLSELLRRFGRLRLWSAGCSYGAEAYSMAILLAEHGGGGHLVLGTDIDASILSRAAAAMFGSQELKNVSTVRLRRFFVRDGDRWCVAPSIRAMVTFRRHNLLSDPFESGWHLIACRNVVIYFTDDAKEDLYRRFYESLVPGGYLFVGSTEQIFRARALGFESPFPFFYRKPLVDRS